MRAWFRAIAYTRSHPDDASSIMAREFNVAPDEFRRMAAGARLADLADTERTFGTVDKPGPIRQLALDASALWMQSGVIKRPVPPDEVIDWSIVERLRRGEA